GHVAYWLQGPVSLASLRDAAALARRRGAELHLLHVVPPVSEGLLMDSLFNDQPLSEAAATDWLGDMAARVQGDDLRVRLHVTVGSARKEIAGLLKRAQADVLVVEHDALVRRGLWRSSIDRALAGVPCLLLCLPSSPVSQVALPGQRRTALPRLPRLGRAPSALVSLRNALQRSRAP
ncbi:universal stress protein, partial [Xanthomonas sp. Kuri4-1]